MKPIAIFRHAPFEGPGYLAEFLVAHQLPWQLIAIDAGDDVPSSAAVFSGLVFMGGPMSVNDDLPWIEPVLTLIRDAVARDIPLLGHCLGGQLISKAMGAKVLRNPVKEIGWGKVTVADSDAGRAWFGDIGEFDAFHWHGETFTLPPGAELVLSSQYCASQAFALGRHLGMQCHVEMTAEMVREWYAVGAEEVAAALASPAVQPAGLALADIDARAAALNAVADGIYRRWIGPICRGR